MKRQIALFYDGYEVKALDRPFGRLQSGLHLAARTAYRNLRGRQPYTGFYTAFRNLVKGLTSLGVEVRVNDFAHARRHPDQVIGIAGFPGVFDRVQLPNPAVFGPGFVPAPDDLDRIAGHLDIRIFTQPCEWSCRLWESRLGDRAKPMPVPIILPDWPDLSAHPKSCDVIIYDKIHVGRDEMVPRVLDRLKRHLAARGLTHQVLRYGQHTLRDYRSALAGGRALAFLSQHETQGLAYQEAMASGLPVFAWDEGQLADPEERRFAPPDLVVSSVPYFDARCGLTFVEAQVEQRFDQFWERLASYQPRAFVAERLNPQRCAQRYLDLLDQAAEMPRSV